jgi:hypothetical protein
MKRHLAPVVLALLTLLMIGCGGNGSTVLPTTALPATGNALVQVLWLEQAALHKSRAIPLKAQSVRVALMQGTTVLAEAVLTPAAPSKTFTGLPAVSLTAVARAYPDTDATGALLASANAPVNVVAGQITPVAITLASAVTKVVLVPSAPTVAAGGTLSLTATALDKDNAIVPVPTGSLTWSSSAVTIASVDAATGVLTGVADGTATITAQVALGPGDPGVTGTATATVHAGVAIR